MSKFIAIFAVVFALCVIEGQGIQIIGGCAGTQYGCAPGQREAELERLRQYELPPPFYIGGCAGTQNGCAPGEKEAEMESFRRFKPVIY